MNVAAPAYSPPVEKPWMNFSRISRTDDADLLVGRQAADEERACGHHDDREREDRLASHPVPDGAEDQSAERADEERHREGGEARQPVPR